LKEEPGKMISGLSGRRGGKTKVALEKKGRKKEKGLICTFHFIHS